LADIVDKVREAVTDRADLPGMSLMEHLGELRKRLIHSAVALLLGFAVAYGFHEKLYNIVQHPVLQMGFKLHFTHPTDPINLYIKTALYGGIILASPYILYQVWLFIAPGMYANEKRFVVPFMFVTVALFLAGAWFGYRYVMPGAIKVLVGDFGRNFDPILTIEDYTSFFLAVVVGLGASFELPVVMFFLALFGIVDGKFLLKHFRYAVLIIFVVAAVICPTPDPIGMCLFASPMLVLYFLGVGAAFLVHPDRRKKKAIASV
jgi:sec-independent protein translocase protein TatC